MTSDDFLKNKKNMILYSMDIHTAFQVSKDLYNSISYLKPNGIIMLDDVFPQKRTRSIKFK